MDKFFKKLNKKGVSELRQDLALAHVIITLLSLTAVVLLTLGMTLTIQFDQTLSVIASVLLSILALISLGISMQLFRLKK